MLNFPIIVSSSVVFGTMNFQNNDFILSHAFIFFLVSFLNSLSDRLLVTVDEIKGRKIKL